MRLKLGTSKENVSVMLTRKGGSNDGRNSTSCREEYHGEEDGTHVMSTTDI